MKVYLDDADLDLLRAASRLAENAYFAAGTDQRQTYMEKARRCIPELIRYIPRVNLVQALAEVLFRENNPSAEEDERPDLHALTLAEEVIPYPQAAREVLVPPKRGRPSRFAPTRA